MKEQLISLETAKLASDIGYSPILLGDNFKDKLPTQSLLQKWLREVHNIHVIAVSGGENGLPSYDYCVMVNRINHNLDDGDYSYEEALEKGLQESLKLIKTAYNWHEKDNNL